MSAKSALEVGEGRVVDQQQRGANPRQVAQRRIDAGIGGHRVERLDRLGGVALGGEARRRLEPRERRIAAMAAFRDPGESRPCLVRLALCGEVDGADVLGARGPGLLELPVLPALDAADRGDDADAGREHVGAEAVPQLLDLLAADLLVHLAEDRLVTRLIGHAFLAAAAPSGGAAVLALSRCVGRYCSAVAKARQIAPRVTLPRTAAPTATPVFLPATASSVVIPAQAGIHSGIAVRAVAPCTTDFQ